MTLPERYANDGYVVIPTSIPETTLHAARLAEGPLQPSGYHWSDGPRVFEGWKLSQAVRDICWEAEILAAIKVVTGEDAFPFQTISFSKGTNQALHQDAVHFQTLPLGKIVGVWVALEDMDKTNGPLRVVPCSHAQGYRGWWHGKQVEGEQFDAYAGYERVMEAWAAESEQHVVTCRQGSAVIWDLDLLHGGAKILDESRSRYSLAIHYFLDSAVMAWAPMFSNPQEFDYRFKSTRWFDKAGVRRQWSERDGQEVTLF